MGSPFFHFKYVELWNQGKGKFFQILGVYTCGCNGYAFNFYVVECCVFFVFASVDATGIIMFVSLCVCVPVYVCVCVCVCLCV